MITPSIKDSVDLDALLMAGENMNKENNPNLSKRSIGDWSDSDDDAPPPPKRATRAAKAKPQLEAEAPAKKKQPAKSRKKKAEVKEELAEEEENVKDKVLSPRRTRAGRAKAAAAPKKEPKAKKPKAGLKSKYFKEETDDNGNNTPQPVESDEEAIPPPVKKTAKGRKKKASPKRKTAKAENESDWSESDKEEEKPKPKAKSKKRGPKKAVEEKQPEEAQAGPHVEGTYLDDGTLQIEITEAKKNRFNEEYKETPEERNKREWAAYLRSIIAREKREHSQERHRIDLLVHLWLGMSWDKHIDCKFLQVLFLDFIIRFAFLPSKSNDRVLLNLGEHHVNAAA